MSTDDLSDWRLASTLNVFEIALLLKGYHPGDYADLSEENWPSEVRRATYALIQTIQRDCDSGKIDADFAHLEYGGIDWIRTVISVASLDRWLDARGKKTLSAALGGAPKVTRWVNERSNPFFAPKLAAAFQAWDYVSTHQEALRNKRPKTAIKDWLEHNATELKLVKSDGALNRTAIDEIAAVANWDQAGGAPATSIANGTTPRFSQNPPEIHRNPPGDSRKPQGNSTTWDDDIPF